MPTTTNYIWDEQNLLAESDATNTINTVYTNEPQQYGNLISSRVGNTASYHEFDALGSTRQLTNSAGSTTDTAIYDAWGNSVNRTGTTAASLLWFGAFGYYHDAEVLSFYVRARVYSSATSRWLSLELGIGKSKPSRYPYGRNSPVIFFDPDGRQAAGIGVAPGAHPQGGPTIIDPSEGPSGTHLGPHTTKKVDCPKQCTIFGDTCKSSIVTSYRTDASGRILEFQMIFWADPPIIAEQPPFPLPKGPIMPPATKRKCCQSDFERAVNEADYMSLTTWSGAVCRYDSSVFQPFDPLPDPNLMTQAGMPQVCKTLLSGRVRLGQITTPGIADTAGGFVYSVADELASVDMDFHIRVLCGCGGFDPDKRIFKVFNEDVVDFKARLP
jgi:RHS repeat-associated protein